MVPLQLQERLIRCVGGGVIASLVCVGVDDGGVWLRVGHSSWQYMQRGEVSSLLAPLIVIVDCWIEICA